MKQVIFVFLCALTLVTTGAYAQGNQDQQQMMKATEPGQYHKYLEPFVGNWDVTVRMWGRPGQPPSESKASSEQTLIMDGRFLHQTFRGTFMGKPFEGLGLKGYDNVKKMYVSAWIDNSSTTIVQTGRGRFSR
ncbi:MAG TPA: DUF1579 family protein [Acidobacteriota bacterium]|nr:DUF1579 family protein [Acidobacteriota bacterium]